MILKALYDYYDRKGDLPAKGLEYKEIGFLVVLNNNGDFVRFEDRRVDSKHAQKFLVTKSVGRTSAPKANYLYDNGTYVLGVTSKEDGAKCFTTFKNKIEEIYRFYPNSTEIRAVYNFYQKTIDEIAKAIKGDPLWEEVEKNLNKKFSNFSFLIEGETRIVAEKKEYLCLPDYDRNEIGQICLVTGERSNTVETTTSTMIVGSQATAKLVSFQVNSGYDSYGKKQGYNAPIGEDAEFKYTTALNDLLRTDSRNKFLVGSRTFVFWASSELGRTAEEGLWALLGFQSDNDDPTRKSQQVREVFNSIYTGKLKTSLEDKFYILGLSPNSARIAVSYWAEIRLRDFAGLILKHFEDMEIVDTRIEKKTYSGLHSMLAAVTLGGKVSDVIPNLPESVVKSIFQGFPYPQPLYSAAIRRIKAEQNVGITRVAIIKAYLNRLNSNEQKIQVMLDKENTNQGYLCGRLFAVLDKIQGDANGQHSIKERYMNSASTTPAAVFATIMNLSSHHTVKLSEGSAVFYEKIKQEIFDKISANGFPSHLDLNDQGRFFVGYYHQQQAFYTKNAE